jgi:hypothetical protein
MDQEISISTNTSENFAAASICCSDGLADMLQPVWNELYYHVDVCIITNGAHIEHL